jgi:hypothetical protein
MNNKRKMKKKRMNKTTELNKTVLTIFAKKIKIKINEQSFLESSLKTIKQTLPEGDRNIQFKFISLLMNVVSFAKKFFSKKDISKLISLNQNCSNSFKSHFPHHIFDICNIIQGNVKQVPNMR